MHGNENPAAVGEPRTGLIGNTLDDADFTFPLPEPQASWPARQLPADGLPESVIVPQPSREAAESFLRHQVRDAIHLVSIEPDGPGIDGRYFGEDAAEAAKWAIAENLRRRNVYWTVNVIRPGCNRKPKKGDITEARFVHVDVDPPKNGGFDRGAKLLRLDLLACPPSLIIDSGNGLQALWRLERSASDWQAIEAINRGAEPALGADHCHNIDRLLRIPGTVNYPDKKKRAAGRVPVLAASVSAYEDATYAADALAKLFPPRRPDKKESEKVTLGPFDLITADDLAMPDRELIRGAIEHPKGEDRSADGFRCACLMLHAGATPEQVAGILLNPENAVSGHYLDQANPERAVRRVIEHAGVEVKMEFPPIAELPAAVAAAPPAESATPSKPKRLYFVNYSDVKPVLNRRYIVKSLLMAGGMSVLYGDSWVGKTFVAVDLCFFIGAGLDWRGLKVRKGLVLYVACEGGELINNRIVALRERYPGVEAALALVPCSVDLLHPNGDVQALIDLVKQAEDANGDKAVLIVVDTTSRALAGGNENSPDDMGAFVRNVDKIRAATGAHTMLLHHVGKDATKGARGHSLLRAATDTEIEVADRQITVTKQRDGKALPTFRFELVTTILGVDDEGEFVDTCTVDYPAPGAAPSPASLAAIEAALPDEDARLLGILRSFDNPDGAPDRAGVSLEAITDAAARADWTKAKGEGAKDVVRRGLNRLKAAGLATSAGARGKARWKATAVPPAAAKETAA
jgi:hypothetical protein